jgi:hypothetical protein
MSGKVQIKCNPMALRVKVILKDLKILHDGFYSSTVFRTTPLGILNKFSLFIP